MFSLAPDVAEAEVPLDLSWTAPANCPQAPEVRERIRAIAGASLARMSRLRAEGRIATVDGGYRLSLKLHDGTQTRDRIIDSSSCADLAGAAAVTLGVLLRSASESGTSRESDESGGGAGGTSPDVSSSAPGAIAPSTPRAERPEASSRTGTTTASVSPTPDARAGGERAGAAVRNWQLFVRAPLGGLELGRLPGSSWGLGVGLGARYESWRVGADARIFRRQSIWSSDFSEVGAAVAPASVSLWTCRGFGRSRFELGPCLAIELERLTLRGTGPNVVTRPQTVTTLAVAAGGAAHLYVSDWFALVGGITLGVSSSRPSVVLGGLGEVRQLGALKLSLTLGTEWIF